MSEDTRTGAETFIVEVPPAWRSTEPASDGAFEMFMLQGDVSLDGVAAGSGGYVHLPQGCSGGELGSTHGGLGLVWWNPNQPSFPPPYTTNLIQRVWDLPWQPSLGEGQHGVMHKSLRLPDPTGSGYDGGPGGFLRLIAIEAQSAAPFEHVHAECWEEIICLSGDVMLADEGIMANGSVVSHPQEWWHGPFASRNGAILVNHTDAPMGFPWPPRDYPAQQELCDTYLDITSWEGVNSHTPWEEVDPRLHALQDTDEFRAWSQSDAAAEYGDTVGRDVVATFRSSWSRNV